MRPHPVVLSIAGSDCSGGAGIQADIKTISALGGYAASAITAVTVQNTLGISDVQIMSADFVRKQIETVMEDLEPDAIKIGMVNDVETIRIIIDCICKYEPEYIVYDPVMVSTSGRKLITDEAIAVIKNELFQAINLLTPNIQEAAILSGMEIHTIEDMKKAAAQLAEEYSISILIKGGHLEGNIMCDVYSAFGDVSILYRTPRIETNNLHGTGCTLSAAIATYLAKDYEMEEAIGLAKKYITQAIIDGRNLEIGYGNGPLWHFPDF